MTASNVHSNQINEVIRMAQDAPAVLKAEAIALAVNVSTVNKANNHLVTALSTILNAISGLGAQVDVHT